ncbi:hypothetical protein OAT16_07480 [Prolixibacteraceae bacterium]|nr:hypothetical protein [Prolixibacteraceae bacterium]
MNTNGKATTVMTKSSSINIEGQFQAKKIIFKNEQEGVIVKTDNVHRLIVMKYTKDGKLINCGEIEFFNKDEGNDDKDYEFVITNSQGKFKRYIVCDGHILKTKGFGNCVVDSFDSIADNGATMLMLVLEPEIVAAGVLLHCGLEML